jgi:hypothetical protein
MIQLSNMNTNKLPQQSAKNQAVSQTNCMNQSITIQSAHRPQLNSLLIN